MPLVSGTYEAAENTLRLWHPQPVTLDDHALVDRFFTEVSDWVRQCPQPPYLLVDYANLQIAATMTQHYAAQVKAYRQKVLGVFRYNLTADTEGVLTKGARRAAERPRA